VLYQPTKRAVSALITCVCVSQCRLCLSSISLGVSVERDSATVFALGESCEGDDLKEVIDTKYCYGSSDERTNVRLTNRNLVRGCFKGISERYKLSSAGNSEVKFCCS
jgi:hypothetical protein